MPAPAPDAETPSESERARRLAPLLRAAIALQALAAAVWLGYQLWRLVAAAPPIWPGSTRGGLDLEYLRAWGRLWFDGVDPYLRANTAPYRPATYPPASFVLLWPFWGWLSLPVARALWALSCVASLAWLSRRMARDAAGPNRLERVCAALAPPALYATGATIGNGQLGLHVVPALLAAVLLLHRAPPRAARTAAAGALTLFALAKPSLTAALFWVVLAAPGGLAAGGLAAAGYAALTLFAGLFQSEPLVALLGRWVAETAATAPRAALTLSHGNLHAWMLGAGLGRWYVPAAVAIVVALGLWVMRHRHLDPWLQLGVAALASRLLAYHGWYDDLVLLLPAVALARQLRAPTAAAANPPAIPPRVRAAVGTLLVLLWGSLLAPGGQYLLPAPWSRVFLSAQLAVWLATLATLLVLASRSRRQALATT